MPDAAPPPSGDFDGCSRDCRTTGTHTLVWGRCGHASEPPRPDPEFGFWRTTVMQDGHPSLSKASIPLLAVLPWAARLSVDERWQMLDEAADARDPTACLRRWRQRVDGRNPIQINMAGSPSTPAQPPGFGPGHIAAAYEQGRRQGRHDAGH